MINKNNVVKKNWEFQKILDSHNQVISRNLIIYFNKSDFFKVGISIPKQFANAVLRNHYKNQIRSILRNIDFSTLNYETVIIARKGFLSLDWNQKVKEVKKLYERIADGK
ncbi:ribonuclease P protein component [Metamycoplasma hominis]|uniref:Ribonuclease P protein component n=1 Tax=Metamycoplasma hominis TaxID=2098 RepID=A0A454C8Q8_METHO|nr:ribonuclease P protein component [Metamycoplasma hominis]AIU33757.1 ribonuclease P protein component [Metamycoplasma hominis ATCC 27545]AKJ52281.1 ribonuclease P protein component [Metamycoplasma hominis]AYK04372.1 ribonuclease P protein component [Metamycoplasma hominis]AYN65112.1 ribonuclease P protein component [Metamycoplasma hominis]KGF61349.1 ribonuclease P [Metamycoplasma hominis]